MKLRLGSEIFVLGFWEFCVWVLITLCLGSEKPRFSLNRLCLMYFRKNDSTSENCVLGFWICYARVLRGIRLGCGNFVFGFWKVCVVYFRIVATHLFAETLFWDTTVYMSSDRCGAQDMESKYGYCVWFQQVVYLWLSQSCAHTYHNTISHTPLNWTN